MNTTFLPRRGLAALAVTLTLGAGVITACGSSNSSTATDGSSSSTSTTSATFGPACNQVPTSGPGSFNGMATAPVATAASANPLLSTLVTAVKKAGLVDTLNSADGITVFAPANPAFAKIPAKQLKAILANKKLLTTILTHHVIAGQLTPDQLAGTHKTLAGDTIKVTGTSPNFKVGTEGAKILCGNVQTANATVYIIDTVLSPSK